MYRRTKSSERRLHWLQGAKLAVAAAVVAGSLYMPSYADASEVDTIRVAMFADLGSTYKSTTPAVTMQTAGNGSAGIIGSNGYEAWITLSNADEVRFSVDGYRVKVFETNEFAKAAAITKALQSTADKPIMYSASKSGKTVYQVYAGNYNTLSLAEAASSRIAQNNSTLLNGQKPAVKGSKHSSVGVYASKAAADKVRSTITAEGLDAYTVLQATGTGAPEYAVWIGEETTDALLTSVEKAVKQQLQQLTVTPVSPNTKAIIIREDTTLNLASPAARDHYIVSGNDAKLVLDGGDAGIRVTERSARTYRGDFEISTYNGQLALVNELPLEQYLYSVVGTEVYTSWPEETLKAQAVAARSYALYQGNRFTIANVVDTTLSQAYNGIGAEHERVTQAVNATAGEVLKSGGKIIEAIFSSNAGGTTADPSEVWNGGGNLFASVASPGDQAAQQGTYEWYHVLLTDGKTGYVREDNTKLLEGTTAAGLPKLTVTAQNTNVRKIPLIQSTVNPIAQLNPGTEVVVLGKVNESGSFSWMRGPFTSAEVVAMLQGKVNTAVPSSITSLEVTERGPSGRALEVQANGQVLGVKYGDAYRSAFGSLPSTLFDITDTGSYTVLGANGQTAEKKGSGGAHVISASGTSSYSGNSMVVMNGEGDARAVSKTQSFLFNGQGYGHGLGLSQWGAKGMADEGYDYQSILKHYYQNVTIVKE
ncbi:SpoIID/LytB domain-containing protein [Paenibacillus urinalis]|uniref:SpoIID/LytB domain-containing protein n=1 Tax=Paenibacillus urinalis TaxID=521520 RepID=A0AAX3MW18_9BACL|nr:SpoIID/LytB domain-containing protein [Paenibacillus urinalis]WDH81790.1 SpoIID/LytB domain-containing protein [Paenibacillus urinalis]